MENPVSRGGNALFRAVVAQPYVLLVLAPTFWGGNMAASKLAVGQVDPYLFLLLRWIGAVLLLVPFALPQVRRDSAAIKSSIWWLAFYGALGFAGFNMLVYGAAHFTAAVNISIEQATIPVLVFTGSFIAFRVKARTLQVLGLVLTVTGVVFVATHGEPARILNLDVNIGDAMVLLACLLYALYSLTLRYRPDIHWLRLHVHHGAGRPSGFAGLPVRVRRRHRHAGQRSAGDYADRLGLHRLCHALSLDLRPALLCARARDRRPQPRLDLHQPAADHRNNPVGHHPRRDLAVLPSAGRRARRDRHRPVRIRDTGTAVSLDVNLIVLGGLVFLLAGTIKGVVGIGLPIAAVGLLSQFIEPRMAILMAIFPIVVGNIWQVYRSGNVLPTLKRFGVFAVTLAITLFVTTLFVHGISTEILVFALGVMIVLFAVTNLAFTPPALPARHDRAGQIVAGIASGISGGLTAIWGPPMVIYFLARRLDKDEFIRASGLLFLCGSIPLLAGYVNNGMITSDTALLSALMVVPTLVGFAIGEQLRRRLDASRFRTAVLVMFLIMGLNLLREAFF